MAQTQQVVPVSPPGARFGPAETSLAINPANSYNLVAVSLTAAGTSLAYVSHDRGASWVASAVPNPEQRLQGDDAVVFDAQGIAYHSFIAFAGLNQPDAASHSSGLFVTVSHDGGRTWRAPIAVVDNAQSVSPFQDKPYLRADRGPDSPHEGNLYISWTRFDDYQSFDPGCRSHIWLARSEDQGVSFFQPVQVSDQAGDCLDDDDTLQGAVPAVGPEGQLYVVWAGPQGLVFDRSLDGGQSFGQDRLIASNPGGWKIPIDGYFRHNGMPVTGVDLSEGPDRGTLYVNWIDERNGDTDVFLIRSRDGGQTWSQPLRINDDPLANGRSQFFTWMAVDPVDGSVNIVFYDRRDTQGTFSRLTLARSNDGGRTFANHPIGLPSFECSPGLFFGDYSGIDALGGRVAAIFTHCPSRSTLAVSAALFDFQSGDAGSLMGLDSPQDFDKQRGVVFDFEGFETGSRSEAILSRWGIRMSSGATIEPGSLPQGNGSDQSVQVLSEEGAGAGPSLIIDFQRPVRKAGAVITSSGPDSQAVLTAFDSAGQLLGEVEFDFQDQPQRFAGVGSEAPEGISKLLVSQPQGNLLELDDLTLEFEQPPRFETCLAQVANGFSDQGFSLRTLIGVANPWNFPVAGTLRFSAGDGDELTVVIGGLSESEFEVELPAYGAAHLETGGDELAVGYACLESTAPLQATATFQMLSLDGGVLAEAGVESASGQHLAVTSVSRSPASGLDSGIAMANAFDEPLQVSISLIEDGQPSHHALMQLPARGHAARFLGELFPGLAEDDLQGSLRISASRPLTVAALRTVQGRLLSSLPVAGTAQ